MKNYEKYKDLVIDCVKKDVSCALAEKAYGYHKCANRKCSECAEFVAKWLYEDYTPKIDWSKVPVDTPVICTDHRGKKLNRYFSGYEDGSISVFSYGATSWSASGDASIRDAEQVELARQEDIEKYSI